MSRAWALGLLGGLASVTAIAATSAPAKPAHPRGLPAKPSAAKPQPAGARVAEKQADFFESNIRPVLFESCVKCHGPAKQLANLRLDSRAALVKGGGRGSVLNAADPAKSLLVQVMAYTHRSVRMPPTKQLPATTVTAFTRWVKEGAPWPDYGKDEGVPAAALWSLQPVKKPAPPRVRNAAWVRNPIDAFVLQKLEAKGMVPAPPASKQQLVRRLYFDLTGLPPTPDEVAQFLADRSPRAYEQLVDRLLASPRYGERWARHWLDLVRYADTNGYERDAEKKYSWKYRDYIIRSLNADKPYNRFLTEQLAGDEMPGRNEETYTATGFLRLGTWDDEPNDPLEYRYERLDDLVHTAATTFVGLTVKCARCHDHKFDPLSQKDYYAFGAAFYGGYLDAGDRELMGGPPASAIPYPVLAFTDKGKEAPPLRLLEKGDARREAEVVPPGFLSAVKLAGAAPVASSPDAKTTGRRLRLAHWLTHPAHPLTARVFVNRLWQHHFGAGLVHSANNFGVKGDRPTHPELLDWLASTFRDPAGVAWRIKPMHRVIVLSNTYRMASVHPRGPAYSQKDFANDWLWRQNRRRLDADAMRDAMLAVSGELNLKEGGPGFVPTVQREALEGLSRKGAEWVPSAPEEQRRRTIYMFLKRALIMPLLTVFDFPDTTQPVEARDSTLVAPQALALLNNPFVHEQSDALARRIAAEAGADAGKRAERAWQLAFGRSPTAGERAAAVEHLKSTATVRGLGGGKVSPGEVPQQGLALRLRADQGVTLDDEGRVAGWASEGSGAHHAGQSEPGARPLLVPDGLHGKPVLRFDGKGRFLRLNGQVLTSQQYTLFAVVNDRALGSGHRVIFSDWTPTNSTTSAFLGLTANSFRLSDHFSPAGSVAQPDRHFILTGVSGAEGATIYQDRREAARRQAPLPTRKLDTPYVIGQQGSINGEFWNGDLAELLVYNRELSEAEREQVWDALSHRYGISVRPPSPEPALASLCRVLLNSNEFIYVD